MTRLKTLFVYIIGNGQIKEEPTLFGDRWEPGNVMYDPEPGIRAGQWPRTFENVVFDQFYQRF